MGKTLGLTETGALDSCMPMWKAQKSPPGFASCLHPVPVQKDANTDFTAVVTVTDSDGEESSEQDVDFVYQQATSKDLVSKSGLTGLGSAVFMYPEMYRHNLGSYLQDPSQEAYSFWAKENPEEYLKWFPQTGFVYSKSGGEPAKYRPMPTLVENKNDLVLTAQTKKLAYDNMPMDMLFSNGLVHYCCNDHFRYHDDWKSNTAQMNVLGDGLTFDPCGGEARAAHQNKIELNSKFPMCCTYIGMVKPW